MHVMKKIFYTLTGLMFFALASAQVNTTTPATNPANRQITNPVQQPSTTISTPSTATTPGMNNNSIYGNPAGTTSNSTTITNTPTVQPTVTTPTITNPSTTTTTTSPTTVTPGAGTPTTRPAGSQPNSTTPATGTTPTGTTTPVTPNRP